MSHNEIKAIAELAKNCNNNTISNELIQHLYDWYGIELNQDKINDQINY